MSFWARPTVAANRAFLRGHRAGVVEPLHRGDVPADHAVQMRSDRVRAVDLVAGGAALEHRGAGVRIGGGDQRADVHRLLGVPGFGVRRGLIRALDDEGHRVRGRVEDRPRGGRDQQEHQKAAAHRPDKLGDLHRVHGIVPLSSPWRGPPGLRLT
jgi:hypothetical protein